MKKARRPPAKKKTVKPAFPPPVSFSEDSREIRKELRRLAGSSAPSLETRKELREQYLYLFDIYLREKPYQKILAILETRLHDFEIMGKIVKLSAFANPRTIIEDEMRRGIKTVVIVGNDETLAKVFTRAADLEVTFGFMPVGQRKNYLAEVLGIPLNEGAAEVIAARKIEKLDYGIINKNRFFLSYLFIPGARARVECDENFRLKLGPEKFETAAANLLPPPFDEKNFKLNPQDGRMEIYLRPAAKGALSFFIKGKKESRASVFSFRRLAIVSEKPMLVLADGKESQETAVEIEVAKRGLKMIVGKNRKF